MSDACLRFHRSSRTKDFAKPKFRNFEQNSFASKLPYRWAARSNFRKKTTVLRGPVNKNGPSPHPVLAAVSAERDNTDVCIRRFAYDQANQAIAQ
jgi:hypothetical protein